MANKLDKMGVPSKMHPVDKIRGQISVSHKKIRMRGRRVGPIDPKGRPNLDNLPSKCISTWSAPYPT